MKDEIKEILDYLKNDNYFTEIPEYEVSPYDLYKSLNSVQTDKLLDYITNLQEENKRLKEENKHIFANVNDDQLLRSNAMNYAEAQDYKTRNEKAIEYIKEKDLTNNANFMDDGVGYLFEDTINILQGSDKE